MASAINAPVSASGNGGIDPNEAAHFGGLAADWWDPRGASAMLHRLNPVRLRYIREQIDRHWGFDERERRPLTGKRALDMGCGGGLLTEPLARLGAALTGIDAAAPAIGAARAHAERQELTIDYRAGGTEAIAGARFDLIVSMEVIEHVPDPHDFLARIAEALTEDGLLILSTPNRTVLSRAAMITFGEGFGLIPKGTHDWRKFITPGELAAMLAEAGLAPLDTRGLSFSPGAGLKLSDDRALNYFVTARRSG